MTLNVSCNKSKNASVRFFICMFSMCVQLFTAFNHSMKLEEFPECSKFVLTIVNYSVGDWVFVNELPSFI